MAIRFFSDPVRVFVNRTQSDPGFVNPVRSGPGLVNPIRSDPVLVLLTPLLIGRDKESVGLLHEGTSSIFHQIVLRKVRSYQRC